MGGTHSAIDRDDPAAGRVSSAPGDHTPSDSGMATGNVNKHPAPTTRRLLTPTVARVVDWHWQRAQSRARQS